MVCESLYHIPPCFDEYDDEVWYCWATGGVIGRQKISGEFYSTIEGSDNRNHHTAKRKCDHRDDTANDGVDLSLELEKSHNSVKALDIKTLEKLVLSFNRFLKDNVAARLKYPDQPEKFTDFEIEFHKEIEKLKILSGAPELYPDLVNLNVIPSSFNLLTHDNTDFAIYSEQHINMDLTQGMHEVFLTEPFYGPVSSLHTFDKPADQHIGSAIEALCNWYVENIVKDVSRAGILFAPLHKCFKSTRPVCGYFAETVNDVKELQFFVQTFGGYRVDRLDRMMKEHTAALLKCINTSLRANREALEAVLGNIHSGGRIEREVNVRHVIDLETVIGFCIEAGQAISFDSLLAKAGGVVLAGGAPLIHSLLTAITTYLPVKIPEEKEIRRMRRVANGVRVSVDHYSEWVREILVDVGGATDNSWGLLPYLFATFIFMTSGIWNTTAFNIDTGGFNTNIHCLARCISVVVAGSELVRVEREYRQRRLYSNGYAGDTVEPGMPDRMSFESNIKSTLHLIVKISAGIALDSRNEIDMSYMVAKLIFLDQLCEISPYLPRTTLEMHVRYVVLWSIYCQCYGNSPSNPLALLSISPHSSPAVSVGHALPAIRYTYSDSTPQSSHDLGYFKLGSAYGPHQPYDGHTRGAEHKYRNGRRSGPLDYSSSQKVKSVDGSSSGSRGPQSVAKICCVKNRVGVSFDPGSRRFWSGDKTRGRVILKEGKNDAGAFSSLTE